MIKSDVPNGEKRNVMFTLIVQGGASTGFGYTMDGEDISKLEDLLSELNDKYGMGDEK